MSAVGDARRHPVNVRIVAATKRNLALEIQARLFARPCRLAVALLHLPPLRERKGDLQPLIDALLDNAKRKGKKEAPRYQPNALSPRARNVLLNYPWPGNVRELENTLMRATVWSDEAVLSEQDVRGALFQGGTGPSGGVPALPELGAGFKLNELLTTSAARTSSKPSVRPEVTRPRRRNCSDWAALRSWATVWKSSASSH